MWKNTKVKTIFYDLIENRGLYTKADVTSNHSPLPENIAPCF